MDRFKLGEWTVSPSDCTIKNADTVESIEPKTMDLLVLLARANGELVTRQEIMQSIWQGRYVTDYALNNLVSSLRKYLATDNNKEYIKTRPKRGYKLTSPVEMLPEDDSGVDSAKTSNTAVAQPKYLVVGAILLSLVLLTFFIFQPFSTKLVAERENSIAVLPFSLMAEDDSIAFFADGLGEEIIHQLSMLPEFRTISRTSSFAYRETPMSATEISDKLGVNYLLQGSVRQEEKVLKVNVQLVNAEQDTLLWSQSFAASEDNAFSIQRQISNQIVATLGGTFSQIPKDMLRFTPSSGEAYLHLLRGRRYNQVRTPDSLLKARDEFLMATLLEPEYADAYVDLAVSYLLMGQNKMLTPTEANKEATAAINSALAINPLLPEAYAAQGILAYNNNHIEEAKQAFKSALDLNPDLYLALINYGNLLRSNFQKEAALGYYEKALDISPLSASANWGIGNILLGLGHIDEAIKRYRTCVYRLPEDLNCALGLAYTLRLANQTTDADLSFSKLDKNEFSQDYYYRLAEAWHLLWKGQAEAAEEIYETLLTQYGFNIGGLQSITLINHHLGQEARWFERMAEAFQANKDLLAVKVIFAVSAYFNNKCDIALPVFEQVLTDNYQVFKDTDLMANGLSYPAMLAYCYVQTGQLDEAQNILTLYLKLIQALPQNSYFIPGFTYAKAQYYALVGAPDNADAMLVELKAEEWPLYWLVEKNPMFQSLQASF